MSVVALALLAPAFGSGCGASTRPAESDAGSGERDAEILDGGPPYIDAAIADVVLCDDINEIYCTIDRPICCREENMLEFPGECVIAQRPRFRDCDELLFVQGEIGCFDPERDTYIPEVCPPFRPYCCHEGFGSTSGGMCQDHMLYSDDEVFVHHWECAKVR